MKNARPVTVATFGEALWDILPRGMFLGGAPLNVAYHLSRHGVRALPITALGRDFLGDEIAQRITAWKMDPRFIARLTRWPTGTVRASLSASGSATYQIAQHVAWDRISVPPALPASQPPAAIVFGTLALREPANRRQLTRICAAWPTALRVLDINLRAPFDRADAIAFALQHAQLVKLNDEELARFSGKKVTTPSLMHAAVEIFAHRNALTQVCVTAGARGAGLYWNGKWHWEPGRKVVVRDTVGAGDAFLGALLAALLAHKQSPQRALARACRLGEFIAARDGATPPYRVTTAGKPIDG
ncbi:PfkB family carbohydrate kinase [Oleiharenicola lentus]|uniref:PfkB family carbohydrate kinase n=1 Tax=Oleiharenicola lentus TaxID=2508720 RepID=UPI003F679388